MKSARWRRSSRRSSPSSPRIRRRAAPSRCLITSDEEGPSIDGTVQVDRARSQRWREHRLLRRRRAIVGRAHSATWSRTGAAARCRGRSPSTVSRVTSRIRSSRRQSDPSIGRRASAELAANALGRWQQRIFRRRPGSARTSTPGPARQTSFPGRSELKFNFRYSTASTRESLSERFEAVLRRHRLGYGSGLDRPRQPVPHADAVTSSTSSTRACVRLLAVRRTLSTTGGTSDGRFIADICDEIVELGPVNATIHQLNERVAIADLEPLSRDLSRHTRAA